MKEKKMAALLRPAAVLFLTCLLVTLAVAGTNAVFAERIALQEAATLSASMRKVLAADTYETVHTSAAGEPDAYRGLDTGGGTVGYILITSENGYGGAVSVMTAIQDEKILAVSILDVSSETPGLGQNAAKPDFTNQYTGLTSAPTVVKSGAGTGEIDALTGATITSKAVTRAIEAAFALYEEVGN